MQHERFRSGGRSVHHSGGLNTRTSPMQIYAGTVPPKPIVTSQPVKVSRRFPWVPVLIGGMVLLAVLIVVVAMSSLKAAKAKARQAAAVAAAAQQERSGVDALWSQTVDVACTGLAARAEAAARRLGSLETLAGKVPEATRAALLKETRDQLALAVVLTNRLAGCRAYGTNILAATAAATTIEGLREQHERMRKLSGNMDDFAAYTAKFEKTVGELDARVVKASEQAAKPSPPSGNTALAAPATPSAPAPDESERMPAGADRTHIVNCAADATVRDGTPDHNFGGDKLLSAKLDAGGYVRATYLRFDLQKAQGTIVAAWLRLRVAKTGKEDTPVGVFGCHDIDWIEKGGNSITWNRRQSTDDQMFAKTTIPAGADENTSFVWDVSDHLKRQQAAGKPSVTLVLKGTQGGSEKYAEFFSREAGDSGPKLVLAVNSSKQPPPVVGAKPRVGKPEQALEAYRTALRTHAFADGAATVKELLAAGADLSAEQRAAVQAVAERCALLAELKAQVVARLESNVLPQGWIVSTPPADVLAGDDSALTLRGRVVPWSEVPSRQFLHLVNATVPGAALTVPKKARLVLAAALYCLEQGQSEVGLRYRAQAIQADGALQAVADRLLPDTRQVRINAATAATARVREGLAAAAEALDAVRRDLIGEITTGTIPFAIYKGIGQTSLEFLRKSAKFPDHPDSRLTLSKLALDKGRGENYGGLATGLLIPPKTGEYRFYITVDDAADLWLGTGPSPASKRRLVHVAKYVADDSWTAREEQKSEPVQLQAGRPYYLEVGFCQGSATDRMRVGWSVPGESGIKVIDGKHLAPMPAVPASESGLSDRVAKSAWALIEEADGHLAAGEAALAEAEAACREIGDNATATDAALRTAAAAVQRAAEAARKIEPALAKARPLAQQVVQLRRSKRL